MRRIVYFALLLLLTATTAHADPMFTPAAPGTDIAAGLLDVVIGKLDGASSSVSVLAAGVKVLNYAALCFGVLLFTYFVIVGTLRTAENGELLGKKWSSLWIPLRFVAVTALMVPGASGYSASQAAVIWLAKEGSSAASTAWQESARYIAGGGDLMAANFNSPAYSASLDAAMRTVWRATACTIGFQRRGGFTDAQVGVHITQLGDGSVRMEWGSKVDGTGVAPAQCGSITTSAPAPVASAQDVAIFSIDGVSAGSMSVDTTPAYDAAGSKAVVAAQVRAILDASTMLSSTAQRAAPCFDVPGCDAHGVSQAEVDKAISAASTIYTAGVETAVRALYQSSIGGDRLLQRATRGGWAMGGTTMYTMAQVQTQISRLQSWTPSVVPPTQRDAASTGVIGDGDVYSMTWNADIASQSSATATTTGRALAQWLSKKLSVDPDDKRHALVQIKDIGDQLMGWSQAIIAGSGLLEAGAGLVSNAGNIVGNPMAGLVGSAVGEAAGTVKYGAMTLFGSGTVMSLILPMLPFILWFGSFIGWVIVVGEAVVAAPIWMAAHLHPDGEELTGLGGKGYMVLLEVVMRPFFMVLGLSIAFILSDAALRLLSYMYWSTVDQVQSDSLTGVASIVVLVVMYIAMVWTTTRSTFALVHDLPSTIMRWVGGANATHDKGAEFGSAAQNQASVGWAKAEPQLQRSLGAAGGAARGVMGKLAGRTGRSATQASDYIGPADEG